jgi:FAD/FMN-containing dehydrogenase
LATTHSTSVFDVTALRHAVRGSVLAAGDEGWDDARTPWNVAFEQHPALIVVPTCSADVQAVVRFAAANGLRVAPQGTGHGVASLGDVSDAVLLRMHELRDVQIDVEAQQARVGAGAIWEDVVNPAAQHGLAVMHGSSPDVGVTGYTLGGGMGWLARKHGFAANSVTAIEVVTADGEFRRVDHIHERDLFFALRGGGGNFGVVTAIEFELFPIKQVYAGWLIWPWEQSEEVLTAWRDWTETTPDEVTSVGRILQLPPIELIPEPLRGRNIVVVEVCYLGDEESGRRLLAPLLELEPELSTLATMPAAGLVRLHNDPEGHTPAIGDGAVIDALPDEAIQAFVGVAGPGSGSPFISVELRQAGGALGRPAPGAGAASHLEGDFVMFSVGLPFSPELAEAQEQHLDVVAEAMAPWKAEQHYFNFAERAIDSEAFYAGATHARLREIRERFDPLELFHANQRIEPAGSDW